MHYGATHLIFQMADELRKNATHAEMIVWGWLSGNQFGVKFRRQHPLSLYIADFYCHAIKLVIEIDGSIHNKSDVKINDVIRQKDIESFGIKVIRFTNREVMLEPEKVVKIIREEIDERKKAPNP